MEFPEFLGNEETKAALSAAFETGRFPHAVVLQGEAGCGKRTLAKLLAKGLVCRDKAHAPCGQCPSCIRAAAGSHPDIRIVEGSGATRSLSVDTVKEITADAYRMPEEADLSVYILLMGSRTSDAAQNKLLKVIEEPPAGAVFLLVCESAEQLLPTIRSRVQSFTLKPPSEEEAAERCAALLEIPLKEAEQLAALCGGNLGRMIEEREGGEAARVRETAVEIAEGMLQSSADKLLTACVPLQKDRKFCAAVLDRLELIFRDAVALRSGSRRLTGGAPQAAERLSTLPMKKLCALPDLAVDFRQKLERNANMTLLVTCLCTALRQGT